MNALVRKMIDLARFGGGLVPIAFRAIALGTNVIAPVSGHFVNEPNSLTITLLPWKRCRSISVNMEE